MPVDRFRTMRIEIILPWPARELSPNARTHHMAKAKASKKYRYECAVISRVAKQASACQLAELQEHIEAGVFFAMWIDFFPPDRRHRDDDNLIASFKSCRDGLADALGINDKRFRMMPFLQTSTHPSGKVVVRITEMPELPDQRDACAVSAGKKIPGSNGATTPNRANQKEWVNYER